ncbi:MAG: hypothetical protein MJZ33_01925 [Paludibacteraceae bacterium]|nr:hypothetical protein [Paludibacteraceae bacterium]
MNDLLPYDPKNAMSIYEHASLLIDKSLHMLYPDAQLHERKGKGGLGQMVEEIHYHYTPNSISGPDFADAGIELKCTPLKKDKQGYAIKERLVCNMIDYVETDNQKTLAESHFWKKCKHMLLVFYLHQAHSLLCDLVFIYRVLWAFPEKDRLIIEQDYAIIYNKIHNGLAHTLSEGDTMYLGACRKGQKGDSLREQPHSSIGAKRRAFSLKPAYMRTILEQVKKSPNRSLCAYVQDKSELVSIDELKRKSFEDIILERFNPYFGKNYLEIAKDLGQKISNAKHKYSLIANRIASQCNINDINDSEEFQKSGIRLKTIRVEHSGSIKESMAFKNIDYEEVFNCDRWTDSELFEIFTSRFMFVVFKHKHKSATIKISDKEENEYVLDKVFFWTMPQNDIDLAEQYWQHIRNNVVDNHIELKYFWNISDNKNFHVRPKGTKQSYHTDVNPHGGSADRYCYWFNAQYVQSIINSQDTLND